jgi:hypothetical protein
LLVDVLELFGGVADLKRLFIIVVEDFFSLQMLEDRVTWTGKRIQESEELLFGSSEEYIVFCFLVSLIFHK